MGKIKQIIVDTGVEDVAIIPDSVRREAALEDAQRLLEAETERTLADEQMDALAGYTKVSLQRDEEVTDIL